MVSQVSSAHVYLRMQPGQSIDDVPTHLIDDCAQLVKANSIKGMLSLYLYRLKELNAAN